MEPENGGRLTHLNPVGKMASVGMRPDWLLSWKQLGTPGLQSLAQNVFEVAQGRGAPMVPGLPARLHNAQASAAPRAHCGGCRQLSLEGLL